MASGDDGCVSVVNDWIKESETRNYGLTDYGVVIIPITNTIQQIKYKYGGFIFLKKEKDKNQPEIKSFVQLQKILLEVGWLYLSLTN